MFKEASAVVYFHMTLQMALVLAVPPHNSSLSPFFVPPPHLAIPLLSPWSL